MTSEHQTIRVVAAVIEDGGKYLITQRRPAAALPLLWEFPGGKVEEGESDAQALEREIMHRLGVEVKTGELISYVTHPYEHYSVELYLYACKILAGEAAGFQQGNSQCITHHQSCSGAGGGC